MGDHFVDVIEQIQDGSAVSRSAEAVKPNLRKIQVGRQHVVFFWETEERIEVVWVLDEQMDVGRV